MPSRAAASGRYDSMAGASSHEIFFLLRLIFCGQAAAAPEHAPARLARRRTARARAGSDHRRGQRHQRRLLRRPRVAGADAGGKPDVGRGCAAGVRSSVCSGLARGNRQARPRPRRRRELRQHGARGRRNPARRGQGGERGLPLARQTARRPAPERRGCRDRRDSAAWDRLAGRTPERRARRRNGPAGRSGQRALYRGRGADSGARPRREFFQHRAAPADARGRSRRHRADPDRQPRELSALRRRSERGHRSL